MKNKIFNFKSFNEAMKMNGFSVKNLDSKFSDYTFVGNSIIKEDIDFEFEKKGGIIVFSTDVNIEKVSDNKFINRIKQIVTSLLNKYSVKRKVDKVMTKHDQVFGFTIGKFVKGRYKSKDGSMYDENSTSIEIIGIDSETLLSVAEDISMEFKQETVLVKDYQKSSIYLATPKSDNQDD